MNQGYLHQDYAESFSFFGSPRKLQHSGGWVLEREIADTGSHDAMGLYPLFCCNDWNELFRDLEVQRKQWVSLALVTDPFGAYNRSLLERTFDIVCPYKEHYAVDTHMPLDDFVSRSHRSNARRALRKVEVEVCSDPGSFLDDWIELFGVLARKHGIRGVRAFSRAAFERQFQVPGLVMFRAVHAGRTVGLDLWYVQNDVAQGHLVAFSAEGYALGASYATKWTMLSYFQDRVRWVNLGGVPDTTKTAGGGLDHFKRGWSNMTQTAYFCGHIFDNNVYENLAKGKPVTTFFPAYRVGESS